MFRQFENKKDKTMIIFTQTMDEYYKLLHKIKIEGWESDDRTGVGTVALFGEHLKFNITEKFPLLTGKYVPFKLVAAELLWMLSGSTNNEDLKALNGSDRDTIWQEWADETGDLGPIYGKQFRDFNGVDQISNLVSGIIEKPFSRRHIISAWNPALLPDESISPQENVKSGKMALAPCHAFVQFNVRKLSLSERMSLDMLSTDYNKRKLWEIPIESYHEALDEFGVPRYGLSCHLYQRSADMFLGVPFNIASYALLTYMVAHLTKMAPDMLHISFGNAHIYKNHLNQVNELLKRWDFGKGKEIPSLPRLSIVSDKIVGKPNSIDEFALDHFQLEGYEYLPPIKADVAV